MIEMATTPFTTRIDRDLKKRVEKIAKHEDRSASYVVNQAIEAMVQDREYTYSLISLGLQQIDAGETISEAKMDKWVEEWSQGEEAPFPKASKS